MFKMKFSILLLVNACLWIHCHGIENSCPELTSVNHGVLKWSRDHSTVTVVCDENFILVGSSASIHCTALGHWNETLPKCIANDMNERRLQVSKTQAAYHENNTLIFIIFLIVVTSLLFIGIIFITVISGANENEMHINNSDYELRRFELENLLGIKEYYSDL